MFFGGRQVVIPLFFFKVRFFRDPSAAAGRQFFIGPQKKVLFGAVSDEEVLTGWDRLKACDPPSGAPGLGPHEFSQWDP